VAAERYMRRALEVAARGRGTVSPNPLVGCVVVRDGEIVGEGWHERAGGPHAEVVALRAAGASARGADVYVTLEPCAHTGRTPPCTEALLAAGVARVVAAIADEDPVARGGGERLRSAGVQVEFGVCSDEARRQNAVFLHGLATGRPFVIVKGAVSLDGRIAAADGTSRWLTGPGARARAHRLRAEVDAVLVGSGTVVTDDPRLTVRPDGAEAAPPGARQPLRVVLDGRRRTRAHHHVVDSSAPTLVVTAAGGADGPWLAGRAVDVVEVPARGPGGLDLHAVLAALWGRGVRSVLVEGGAQVSSSFVRAGLADRLEIHVAPLVLGEGGVPSFAGHWVQTLAGAPRFALDGVERAGDDVLLTLSPVEES
jgi:diaminohydroxyphosphoribosylaminopyrimidine deaminase/5-amino-6-(5-phosphoribosylamino)uracil reductase